MVKDYRKKRKVYKTAIFKFTKEKEIIEGYLRKINNEITELEEFLKREEERKVLLLAKVEERGMFTPDLIRSFRGVDSNKKELILSRLSTLEREALIMKQEYFKVKRKIDLIKDRVKYTYREEGQLIDSMEEKNILEVYTLHKNRGE